MTSSVQMEDSRRREAPADQAAAGDQSEYMAEDEDVPSESLDVSSDNFDPLLALYSPHTPLPFPEVRCFNNLAEYESFLRGGGRGRARARGAQPGGRRRKGRKPEPDPERIERLKQLMLPVDETKIPVRPRKNRLPKNVLTRMSLHAGSPLGELNRCVQDRLRIKVHIRTFKGLRGVCSGFIVAFDKFWNMAMVDVDETYRKPVLGKAFYNEPQLTLTRLFDRLQLQESGLQPSAESQDTSTKRLPHPSSQTRSQQSHICSSSREHEKNVSETPRSRSQQRQGTESHSRSSSRGHEKKIAESPPPSSQARSQQKTSSESQIRSSSRGHEKKVTVSPNRTAVPKEDDNKSRGRDNSKTRGRNKKVDYQQVFTRHMKQVFIRGENVLLINIAD